MTEKPIRIRSHSPVLFWWPVWSVGFVLGVVTLLTAPEFTNASRPVAVQVLADSGPGVLFALLITFTALLTSVRLRGFVPLIVMGVILVGVIALSVFGGWAVILRFVPDLAVQLSAGFYFLLSFSFLALWLVYFFVLDRLHYWQISEGRLSVRTLFGREVRSTSLEGWNVRQANDDLLRHVIFGFGSGHLILENMTDLSQHVEITNVLGVGRRKRQIREVIAAANLVVATHEPIIPEEEKENPAG